MFLRVILWVLFLFFNASNAMEDEEFVFIEEEKLAEEEFQAIAEEKLSILNQDEVVEFSIHHDPNAYKEYIVNQVIDGGKFMHELLHANFDAVPCTHEEECLASITALMWYLFTQAINKGEAFDEGTFIIQDPGYRLYDFLLGYLISVDKSVPRISSHFNAYYKLKKVKFDQFGIDIPHNLRLPVNKAHILFGKVNEQKELIFIKLENAGLENVTSFVQHTLEFFQAQIRKRHDAFWLLMETQFGNKWLVEDFAELAKYVVGTDDNPEWRKERVPWNVLTNYMTLLQKIPLIEDEEKKVMINDATVLGIQAMVESLGKFVIAIDDDELQQEIQSFINMISAAYDHVDMRFGREVILTVDDMRQSALLYATIKDAGQETEEIKRTRENMNKLIQDTRKERSHAQQRFNVPESMRIRTLKN